jgi:hypothetical protein
VVPLCAALLAAPALTSSLTLLPRATRATVMEPLSIDELAHRASLVVVARALDTHALLIAGRIYTDVALRVEETVRGSAAPGATVVVRTPGGVIGNEGQQVPGAPTFAAGQRYVVFLRTGAGGTVETVALAQGVLPVQEPAASSAVPRVVPAQIGAVAWVAPRGASAPPTVVVPAAGMPLEAFVRAVRALP